MADQKVSQLPAILGANTAAGDLIYIVDISEPLPADQSKKITLTEFQSAPVSAGTANGVLFLNGSKVVTSGSALTFDGTKLVASGGNEAIRIASGAPYYSFYNAAQSTQLGYIQHTGTDLALVNVQNGTMPFYVNNAEGMRLDSTGLGIGTSSPTTRLEVSGAFGTSTTGITLSNNTGFNASNIARFDFRANNSFGGLERIAAIWALNPNAGANNGGALVFGTSANGTATTPTEGMRLDSSGNLGIGTSSPSEKLHVNNSGDGVIRVTGGASGNSYLIARTSGELDIFNAANAAIRFSTNGTTKATLDSSGNLGLGVTPSAWGSPLKAFEMAGASNVYANTNGIDVEVGIGTNWFYNGTSVIYKTSNLASRYAQKNGIHEWYIAPSGTAGNAISFTQALTLTANGNLLVGTTSENSGNGGLKVVGQFALTTSQAFTASGSVNDATYYIVCYALSGTCTLTLPTPANNTGRLLNIVVQSAQQVVSASSNVTKITDGTLTTDILPATAGKWAQLWCDGTYWNIIATNV